MIMQGWFGKRISHAKWRLGYIVRYGDGYEGYMCIGGVFGWKGLGTMSILEPQEHEVR